MQQRACSSNPPMVGQFAGHSSYRTNLINWKPSSNRFNGEASVPAPCCICIHIWKAENTKHYTFTEEATLYYCGWDWLYTLPLTFSGVCNLAASLFLLLGECLQQLHKITMNNSNYKVVIYFLTNSFEETEVKLTIFSHYIRFHVDHMMFVT